MPWDDDFLDELQSSTGLAPEELVDVILRLPQNAAERDRRERERVEAERIEAARLAKERARVLLLDHLDAEQRSSFEANNRFFVISSTGRKFCIHLGRQHNLWLVDDNNQHTTGYCGHIREYVPDEDNVLAQMLLLQSDEAEFLRVANASG